MVVPTTLTDTLMALLTTLQVVAIEGKNEKSQNHKGFDFFVYQYFPLI